MNKYVRRLAILGKFIAILGACLILAAVFVIFGPKPHASGEGDGNDQAYTIVMLAIRGMVAGGILSLAGCFCLYTARLLGRKKT